MTSVSPASGTSELTTLVIGGGAVGFNWSTQLSDQIRRDIPPKEQWEALRGKFGNQRALGMSLDAGGHLTHGFRPNISGKMFHQSSYGTDPETGLLDYDALRGMESPNLTLF